MLGAIRKSRFCWKCQSNCTTNVCHCLWNSATRNVPILHTPLLLSISPQTQSQIHISWLHCATSFTWDLAEHLEQMIQRVTTPLRNHAALVQCSHFIKLHLYHPCRVDILVLDVRRPLILNSPRILQDFPKLLKLDSPEKTERDKTSCHEAWQLHGPHYLQYRVNFSSATPPFLRYK